MSGSSFSREEGQVDVTFPSGAFTIEGICHFPQGRGPFPAVVLCHPHPLYGGSMSNNVIFALSSALVGAKIIAFRFNFRGVGGSQGHFEGGIGEQKDVVAALDYIVLQEEVDAQRVGLAGYSFGASVALPVALEYNRVKALGLISPPVTAQDIAKLKNYVQPKFIICGGEDTVVSPQAIKDALGPEAETKDFELIPGADHFWWGYERNMASKVAAFFSHCFGT